MGQFASTKINISNREKHYKSITNWHVWLPHSTCHLMKKLCPWIMQANADILQQQCGGFKFTVLNLSMWPNCLETLSSLAASSIIALFMGMGGYRVIKSQGKRGQIWALHILSFLLKVHHPNTCMFSLRTSLIPYKTCIYYNS